MSAAHTALATRCGPAAVGSGASSMQVRARTPDGVALAHARM
jgi:hypothetical protein